MEYEVLIGRSAERELDALTPAVRSRIEARLDLLSAEPRPRGTRQLLGRDGYRLRVGDYRVLYTIDDERRRVIASRPRTPRR